jgi:hypothetical protein
MEQIPTCGGHFLLLSLHVFVLLPRPLSLTEATVGDTPCVQSIVCATSQAALLTAEWQPVDQGLAYVASDFHV